MDIYGGCTYCSLFGDEANKRLSSLSMSHKFHVQQVVALREPEGTKTTDLASLGSCFALPFVTPIDRNPVFHCDIGTGITGSCISFELMTNKIFHRSML